MGIAFGAGKSWMGSPPTTSFSGDKVVGIGTSRALLSGEEKKAEAL